MKETQRIRSTLTELSNVLGVAYSSRLLVSVLLFSLTAPGKFMLSLPLSMAIATGCWSIFLSRLALDRITKLVLIAGMPAYWWWFAHAGVRFFAPDIDGHLQYIHYMSQHVFWPPPNEGFLFYHPPLYYTLMGIVQFVFSSASMSIIRLCSLAFFLTFLIYSVRILQMARLPQALYALCLIMLVLWPSGIMLATRVDSDVLLYPLCAAGFYYIAKWYEAPHRQLLAYSLICLGLGLMTRTNAIILGAVIATLVGYSILTGRVTIAYFRQRMLLWCMAFLALACIVNAGRNIYYRETSDVAMPMVVGNSQTVLRWRVFTVGNQPENFLTFNFAEYFSPAFYMPQSNRGGRQYFGVVLLKTMLWGDQPIRNNNLAKWVNGFLLIIMATVCIPVACYRRGEVNERLPLLLLAFISLIALGINRWIMPIGPAQDFRYCYFALPALIALFGQHLAAIRKTGYILYELIIAAALALIYCGDRVYFTQF